MKKICILATALLFASQFTLMAQVPATAGVPAKRVMNPEQREARMTERMTQQLLLSDADAAKFAPLYKKYMEEMRALRPERPEVKKTEDATAKAEKVAPTDAELKKAAKERFARQRKMIDLQEKYYNEFSKFLTAKQVEKVMHPAGERGKGDMHGKQAPKMQDKGMEMRRGKEMGQMGQRKGRNADAKRPSKVAPTKEQESTNS